MTKHFRYLGQYYLAIALLIACVLAFVVGCFRGLVWLILLAGFVGLAAGFLVLLGKTRLELGKPLHFRLWRRRNSRWEDRT